MIHPINVAYANVAKLLNEGGECLITAFSSFDIADVWAEVCETDAWRGRIPDPATIANETFNFNCIKPAAQVESEVRNKLRGTGLECISCEVYHSTWQYADIDSLLGEHRFMKSKHLEDAACWQEGDVPEDNWFATAAAEGTVSTKRWAISMEDKSG
ncbi:hypothetical protein HPB48_013350 [Haemaphysalis longicornis]|uniref:Uncharacterized protein n=1 Tax=Haemaphysalis longicornis TaxID=44386 RepID=A0A9J6FHJ0_HAELO|nr:hypothetical protein HPB48_013350 [Haemaphysalis longicornis]